MIEHTLFFVTESQARRLDSLSFEWKCDKGFPEMKREVVHYYPKPTLDLVCKWLRDIKLIDVEVMPNYNMEGRIYFCQLVIYRPLDKPNNLTVNRVVDAPLAADYTPMSIFATHEEAQSAGVDAALAFLESETI